MKKARILLGAVAILGVVGGASAFKAKTFTGTYYCSTTRTTLFNAETKYSTTLIGGSTLFCSTISDPTTTVGQNAIEVIVNDL